MTALWIAAGILLCLVLSAFFSESEMAYSSCNPLLLASMGIMIEISTANLAIVIKRWSDDIKRLTGNAKYTII